MSSPGTPPFDRVDTRFSTPVPELDDHRLQMPMPTRSPQIPSLEVQLPTPAPRSNTMDPQGLLHVNEALRQRAEISPIARDFESAIIDDDKEDDRIVPSSAPHGSTKKRRLTNRVGRKPHIERFDRSRDTSSSRSSSPADSVEAFAEPRRRLRANTAESHAPSFTEFARGRAYSASTSQRRPTLSNISIPPALTQQADERPEDDVTFPLDEEPGKTYRIDYEELEEFVALSEQGLIAEGQANGRISGASPADAKSQRNSVIAQPLEPYSSQSSCELDEKAFGEKKSRGPEIPKDKFTFFSSEVQGTLTAQKLGDFTKDGATFRDMFELESGVWWLDVQSPSKAELEAICKAFKIHRLTMEDIETQEAREKVELFPQYYFVSFRTFNHDKHSDDFLDPVQFYVCVCGDGVLSFSYEPNPHAKNVRKRIALVKDLMSLGPDWICYALM